VPFWHWCKCYRNPSKQCNFFGRLLADHATIDAIRECSLAVKIADTTAPDKKGLVTYPGAASFLPAPWLLNTVVEAFLSNPSILISKVIEAAQAFDQDHDSDKEYITSAVNHVDDFILWAWGVGAGQVSK
jgi:hypothetical protein